MSTVHVLEQNNGEFRCVLHFAVPAGNNSAGLTWKAVGLASGRTGTTRLTEGTGPGQITTSEKAQVVSGDVVEFESMLRAESGGLTGALLGATVDAMATAAIAAYQAEFARTFKWYGAVRA